MLSLLYINGFFSVSLEILYRSLILFNEKLKDIIYNYLYLEYKSANMRSKNPDAVIVNIFRIAILIGYTTENYKTLKFNRLPV